jgi:GNAT superfamily N-acetyltransferase
VDFPFQLYKDNPCWCPPLKFDDLRTFRKDKNPAFEFCEAEFWLAYQDGRPVGRVAGIINRREVERWNARMVRFGWIDFIDDPEVSRALITTVMEWGRGRGMTGIHGPLGFNDMDPEGMLIEGFDELSAMTVIYNYPYYVDHMNRLGFRKAVDWVEFEVPVPEKIPEKVIRVSRIVAEKYHLRLFKTTRSKELFPFAIKLFTMYNDAYRDLYGFTPLTTRQMEFYTKQYFGYIRPEFISLILNDRDDVVGFGITMPSLSKAMKKANGSLFPFGFLHLLKALRKNDIIHMYLVGVRPDYQGKGALSMIYQDLTGQYIRHGFKLGKTQPMLEENAKVVSVWKNYTFRISARRRCWVMDL